MKIRKLISRYTPIKSSRKAAIGWYAGHAENFVEAYCNARKYLGVHPVSYHCRVDHFHYGLKSYLDLSGLLNGTHTNRLFHPCRFTGRCVGAWHAADLSSPCPQRVGYLLVPADPA